jgi:hypothetical protein
MLLLLATAATAADHAPVEVGFGLSGTGEAVLQDGIVRVYEGMSGSFAAEAVADVSLAIPVDVTLEVGYRRLSGVRIGSDASTWFWYVPISAVILGRLDSGPISLLAGAGPSWVVYAEAPGESSSEERSDSGARPGVLFEASARWRTDWLVPSMRPGATGPRGLDLFASTGFRYSDVSDAARESNSCAEPPCGLDLSAFRVSAGVMVRF